MMICNKWQYETLFDSIGDGQIIAINNCFIHIGYMHTSQHVHQTWVKYFLKVFRINTRILKKIVIWICIQILYTNYIPNTLFRILQKYSEYF
jgi:hypothetical protein